TPASPVRYLDMVVQRLSLVPGNMDLEVEADLGAGHEGVGDVPGAAGPDNVLQVGLDKERPVLEAEGVVPLEDRLLLLHPDSRIEALGDPLGVAQVVAETPVKDAKSGHVPGTRPEDAAGEDAGLEEQRHPTAIVEGRGLHAPRQADAAQELFVRGAELE